MGLTDKHLAYGDDIPQTQTEKEYYWKIKHLKEENDKLKEAVKKIMVEIINDIQGISENPDYKPIGTYDYVTGSEDCRKVVLEIIDKHLSEVSE